MFGSISDSRVYPGVHGMCLQHLSFAKSDAVSCKCIGVVDIDNTIPIKLLNATDTPIVISRGTKIANFTQFDHSCSVLPFEQNVSVQNVCNNVNISPISTSDDTYDDTYDRFLSIYPYDGDTEIDDSDSRAKNNASTDQACATHQDRDSVYIKHYLHTDGDCKDPFEDKFQCSTEDDTDNRTQVNELTVTR